MLRYSELIAVVLSIALGYLGRIVQDWWAARQERVRSESERWSSERQRYFLPLLGAAQQLEERLIRLARIYEGEASGPFTAKGLSRDFREIYLLSDEEISSLYDLDEADPNVPRRDPGLAQRLRTRMCRELNFATSSLYQTARYLALAGLVRQVLEENRTNLPELAVTELRGHIQAVTVGLQGKTGAGIATEQQESMSEVMRTDHERVITQYEFRKRLLEVPGWEQFTALLTFFVTENDDEAHQNAARFGAKVDHEVRATVLALHQLVEALRRLTMLKEPRMYKPASASDVPPPDLW